MADRPDVLSFSVRKRPWFVWVLRLVAVLWLLFWIDTAIGSYHEAEPRALWISLAVLGVSLVGMAAPRFITSCSSPPPRRAASGAEPCRQPKSAASHEN